MVKVPVPAPVMCRENYIVEMGGKFMNVVQK